MKTIALLAVVARVAAVGGASGAGDRSAEPPPRPTTFDLETM
jgi:hypothetical protein